jgi:thiol-disulfide isomerase/thioredoxin
MALVAHSDQAHQPIQQELPMKLRKAVVLFALSSLASIAMAGEIKVFSEQEFDRLTQAGKPVVLDVSATWCPTCKQQKPILEGLMKQPAYADVTLLTIDFDSNKPTLKKFKVAMQSTLVAFKGTKEVGRSVGDTNAESIDALFKKTTD